MSPIITAVGKRFAMFIVGGAVAWITSLLAGGSSTFEFFINWGIIALVIFEIMRLTRHWLSVRVTLFYIVFGIALAYPLANALARLEIGRLDSSFVPIWLSAQTWISLMGTFPTNIIAIVRSATIVGSTRILIGGLTTSGSSSANVLVNQIGYGGSIMESTGDETTRWLCANAVLSGGGFCSKVIQFVKDKHRAVAPELGVDLGLLVRVCVFMEQHRTRYLLGFFILTLFFIGALLIGLGSWGYVGFIILTAALFFYKTNEENKLQGYFTREKYDPAVVAEKFKVDLDADLAEGIPLEDQNLVIYSGFFPFVGLGINLDGWSFAVNVSHAKENMGPEPEIIPFEVTELYQALDQSLKALALPGLSLKDFLFINGTDIREDETILPDLLERPAQKVSVEELAKYIKRSEPHIRYYKWYSIEGWGNDLFTSHFLRCSINGKNLFVEMNQTLMTPLRPQYRRIDGLPLKKWWYPTGLVIGALIAGPLYGLQSWLALFIKLSEGINNLFGIAERQTCELIDTNPLYDYGARNSLRQEFSSPLFAHYFQKIDGQMNRKILERETLNTIVTFLDEHNIDTSELKDRQTTILNSGIMIQGGDVKAESLAVGTGSKAVTEQSISISLRLPGTPRKEG